LVRGRDEEARQALYQLFSILRKIDNSNLPTVSFMGETARMCVELNEFELCEEVCELGLNMDEA
jgi:hypothetical protein